jgi:hypothetical protein
VKWACSRCGAEHEGLPLDWAFPAPAYWEGGRSAGDWLTDDLCRWSDDSGAPTYFIRGVLPIAVEGSTDVLAYGVWSSLSERSFERVTELWDDEALVDEPPYFGWLSNRLPGYPDTLRLQVAVVMRAVERRPALVLLPHDHPLVDEQLHGVSRERALEIAELNIHPV